MNEKEKSPISKIMMTLSALVAGGLIVDIMADFRRTLD